MRPRTSLSADVIVLHARGIARPAVLLLLLLFLTRRWYLLAGFGLVPGLAGRLAARDLHFCLVTPQADSAPSSRQSDKCARRRSSADERRESSVSAASRPRLAAAAVIRPAHKRGPSERALQDKPIKKPAKCGGEPSAASVVATGRRREAVHLPPRRYWSSLGGERKQSAPVAPIRRRGKGTAPHSHRSQSKRGHRRDGPRALLDAPSFEHGLFGVVQSSRRCDRSSSTPQPGLGRSWRSCLLVIALLLLFCC
jgi:hypothetical protein